jgi:protein O-mannosyl-transferase
VLPLAWRISNALSTYFVYIRQMLWPANLALAYGHPEKLPIWQTASAATLLVAITLFVFLFRKRSPYLVVGWCWYLIMLLPVIGFVQVGGQAHADRYTYLPQIGLYIAAAWGIADLSVSWPHRREILDAAAAMVTCALVWCAAKQVWYWHDSERLWRHALAVTGQNEVAHLGLARFWLERKRPEEAIAEYEAAAKIGEPNPDIETDLANLLLQQGRMEDAVRYYREVVQLQPSSALARYNLAVGLHRLGQLSEAIVHYKEALAIEPDYPDAESFLVEALLQNGQADEAKVHLEKR